MIFDSKLVINLGDEVYKPAEDSMLLLEAIDIGIGEKLLEIGTGSGIIALHAAKKAIVVATDVNPEATKVTRLNAIFNGLHVDVICCYMFEGLRGKFDVIAFNPPYLNEEIGNDWTGRAWQGGSAGDELIVEFLKRVEGYMSAGGRAYLLLPWRFLSKVLEDFQHLYPEVVAGRSFFFERLAIIRLINSVR